MYKLLHLLDAETAHELLLLYLEYRLYLLRLFSLCTALTIYC